MFIKKFKNRVIVPAAIILVALSVGVVTYASVVFLSHSDDVVNERFDELIGSLKQHVNDSRGYCKAAAVSMASNAEAIKAIKGKDWKEILRIFGDTHDLYHVSHYTITDPNGYVLARTYSDNVGDSVLEQQNVKDALDGKTSTCFEVCTAAMVGIRSGAPVYDADGTLIGVVSAGVRFDVEGAVDELKKHLRSDVTIFYGDERVASTIVKDGKRVVGTKLAPEIVKTVIEEKQEYSGITNVHDVPYKSFYMPLLNADEEAFAVFSVGTPISELNAKSKALFKNIVAVGFIGMVMSVMFLFLVMRKEVDTVHKLIDNINVTLSEHESGNTDYSPDTEFFQGDFRLLVERVMQFSNQGMKDSLTKLSNRRSFDNRLHSEWYRAMRDRSPLSILFVDVDNFKTYNDTYGHQQGDVVLQSIAGALTMSLRRVVDFVARWGGEEFVVLLPNTDSVGATHVAEKIRSIIEITEIPDINGGDTKNVTVSVGVNTQVPSSEGTVGHFIFQADEALYRAKKGGRNRVCWNENNT
jgi:diguanylate cyclase (GGDEF)-like protein